MLHDDKYYSVTVGKNRFFLEKSQMFSFQFDTKLRNAKVTFILIILTGNFVFRSDGLDSVWCTQAELSPKWLLRREREREREPGCLNTKAGM